MLKVIRKSKESHLEQNDTLSLICTIIYLINFANIVIDLVKWDKFVSSGCKISKVESLRYKISKIKN